MGEESRGGMDLHSAKLALFETFLTEFRQKDTAFTGEVTAQTAHAVLTQHTALSPNQIDELICNAGMTAENSVNYRTFSRTAAQAGAEVALGKTITIAAAAPAPAPAPVTQAPAPVTQAPVAWAPAPEPPVSAAAVPQNMLKATIAALSAPPPPPTGPRPPASPPVSPRCDSPFNEEVESPTQGDFLVMRKAEHQSPTRLGPPSPSRLGQDQQMNSPAKAPLSPMMVRAPRGDLMSPQDGLAALARQSNAEMGGMPPVQGLSQGAPPPSYTAGGVAELYPLSAPGIESVGARGLDSAAGMLRYQDSSVLRSQNSDLQRQVQQQSEMSHHQSETMLSLESTNFELLNRCRASEEELEAANASNTKLHQMNTSQADDITQLQQQLHQLAMENNTLKSTKGNKEVLDLQNQLEQFARQNEMIKTDNTSKEAELAVMRGSWQEREKRLEKLESQRVFYEESLSRIGEKYQVLLDKLSFVVSDYSVRTAPIQVKVDNGYELLSTYLNRIFEDQERLKQQYDKVVPRASNPKSQTSDKGLRAASPLKKPTKSPSKRASQQERFKSPVKPYEPLRTQEISWARGLRSPSPTRKQSPHRKR